MSQARLSSKLGWLGALVLGAHAFLGCASTELEAPLDHPGHPAARAGKTMTSSALSRELDLRVEPAGDGDTPAGHGDHADHADHATHQHPPQTSPAEKAPADAAYTCPMHPEIVENKPGKCPKCGMKLVPKKAEK